MMHAEGVFQFKGDADDPAFIQSTLDRLAALRWLSAAEMPIRNLQIPPTLPDELHHRLTAFKAKCHSWTFPQSTAKGPTAADVVWLLEEAREIIRAMDEHYGIATIRESPSVTRRREPCLTFE